MPPKTDTKEADPLPPAEEAKGVNHEAAHSLAIDRLATMGDELDLNPKELVFDVRDFILDQIKARPKPWSATSQSEQVDVIRAIEQNAETLVRKIIEAVAAGGGDAIRVLLTKVNASGEDIVVTGKVKFFDAEEDEKDRAILGLHHGIGKFVMLKRASLDDYAGGDRDIDGEPDQNDFGFEGDDNSE